MEAVNRRLQDVCMGLVGVAVPNIQWFHLLTFHHVLSSRRVAYANIDSLSTGSLLMNSSSFHSLLSEQSKRRQHGDTVKGVFELKVTSRKNPGHDMGRNLHQTSISNMR